jgi:hypothetical protein
LFRLALGVDIVVVAVVGGVVVFAVIALCAIVGAARIVGRRGLFALERDVIVVVLVTRRIDVTTGAR